MLEVVKSRYKVSDHVFPHFRLGVRAIERRKVLPMDWEGVSMFVFLFSRSE
jgi:hypothetical protein